MTCPECGLPETWAGMSYQPHSETCHERRHTGLYKAIRGQLEGYLNLRLKEAAAASQGLVTIHSLSGVYRGLAYTHTVTREFWDELDGPEAFMRMDRAWLLRHLRESASDCARQQYGVDVNPATWRQRVVVGPWPAERETG